MRAKTLFLVRLGIRCSPRLRGLTAVRLAPPRTGPSSATRGQDPRSFWPARPVAWIS